MPVGRVGVRVPVTAVAPTPQATHRLPDLGPCVPGFVSPVPDPPTPAHTGIPLLVSSVGGREVDGVCPPLKCQDGVGAGGSGRRSRKEEESRGGGGRMGRGGSQQQGQAAGSTRGTGWGLAPRGAGDSPGGTGRAQGAPSPRGGAAAGTEFTYPFLGGFPSKILIHVPVRLPLPVRRGQRHPIQRPVLEPTHVAPRPAVARQECLTEAAHGVPALGARGRDQP